MSRHADRPLRPKDARALGMVWESMRGKSGAGNRHLSESKHAKGRKSPIAKKKNKKKR